MVQWSFIMEIVERGEKKVVQELPARVHPLLRGVQEAGDEVVSREGDVIKGLRGARRSPKRAKDILAEMQQEYTRVEAAIRADAMSVEEALPSILEGMGAMLAVLRHMAGLPQLPPQPVTPENSDDGEEDDVEEEAAKKAAKAAGQKALKDGLEQDSSPETETEWAGRREEWEEEEEEGEEKKEEEGEEKDEEGEEKDEEEEEGEEEAAKKATKAARKMALEEALDRDSSPETEMERREEWEEEEEDEEMEEYEEEYKEEEEGEEKDEEEEEGEEKDEEDPVGRLPNETRGDIEPTLRAILRLRAPISIPASARLRTVSDQSRQ
ncbi:MAG: hypothetical protein M1840_007844 [Geoglossum simile]|nr:MAG: hypothetical protein M1840_007844 [Geoglossum simile]